MSNYNAAGLVFVFCISLFAVPVLADIQVNQQLNFGKIAITSNASVSTTTVRRNGSQLSTNKILVVQAGTPAILQLSNFPAYTTMNLSSNVPVSSAMGYGGTEQFTITALDMPSVVKTDITGQGTLIIGGTLATSGLGGVYYNEAVYNIYLEIEFSY